MSSSPRLAGFYAHIPFPTEPRKSLFPNTFHFLCLNPQVLPFITASILPLSTISFNRMTAYRGLQPTIDAISAAVTVGVSSASSNAVNRTSSVYFTRYEPRLPLFFMVYYMAHMVYNSSAKHNTQIIYSKCDIL